MKKIKSLVCGGTFDFLHKGHKEFIKKALELSDKVLIGITSDSYIKSYKKEIDVQKFEIRKKAVKDYLESINASKKAQIIAINSAYDPNLETSVDYDAILVVDGTYQKALEINQRRKQGNIKQLQIIISPMAVSSDELNISSTRIRNGEINRDGIAYFLSDWRNKDLILPENLRPELKVPWGKILKEIPDTIDESRTIVVGDATAKRFNDKKINQFLSIVDFFINRKKEFNSLLDLGFKREIAEKIKNPHGIITSELFLQVEESFKTKKRKIILIEGEEDLAVLVVLIIAPLGFSVFYGQPNEGLVEVKVTEKNKEKAFKLVEKFKIA